MSHPIYASISRSIPLRPSARATLLAFSLAAGLALPLLVSCAGGSTSSSEVSTRNELKVEGTLLYEEQVGGVHVGFWETPSGLLGITQASVDGPELSKRIAESVKQPTLSEAYRALRAVAGGGAISVPKALSDADARYPITIDPILSADQHGCLPQACDQHVVLATRPTFARRLPVVVPDSGGGH